jgi:hypothetical protein
VQSTTLKNNGTLVGSSPVIDFSAGLGGLVSVSSNGQEISVQTSIDTALLQTRANLQAGVVLLCGSHGTSAPGVVYTCAL